MKKIVQLFVLVSLTSINCCLAQQPSEKLKQVFLDAEYFYMFEDYNEALYSYNSLYKRGFADNANINYRIGQCYLNISGEKYKAIPYLEKASLDVSAKYQEGSFKETHAPIDAYYFLGNAYRIHNELNKAITAYEKFIELTDSKNTKSIDLARNEIKACEYAEEQMKNPVQVSFTNLGRPVSSGVNDFFPAVSGDESVIVYNSAQKFYDAIYFSKKVNNKWSPPQNITPEIESDGKTYVSSVSFDGTELFLRLEDNFEADIHISKYENGKWTKSVPISKAINSKYFEGNACISKDKKTLYFSSNKTGGAGALDLYKSELTGNSSWGPAQNLGNVVNTEFNEDAPSISEDGKRLYFVSQGHNTMGGYDIFYSDLNPDGSWSEPVNLGYPINTTDDNSFFQQIQNGDVAYTNMYAKDGLGYDDIFRVSLKPEVVAQQPAKTEPEVKTDVQPERELPKDVVKNIEEPVDEKTKESIVLRTLFYDFNSSAITETIQKELDHLAMVMQNFTDIKVELTGHADALGNEKYNKLLSERRARQAKEYLVKKGIAAKRISIRGEGEKNHIAINTNPDGTDNPDGRKLNRRVDISLLNSNHDNIKVEPVNVPDQLKIK
jgi:outer membrane protein OmpA-like peptidoglycan-associated protein